MNLEKIKAEAKTAIKKKTLLFFMLILLTVIAEVALFPILIGFLLNPIFTASFFFISKKVLDQNELDADLLIEPFQDINHLFKIIAVFFIGAIIVIGGLIFFIIPGFILLYKYSMALYLITDNKNLTIHDAFNQSKKLMHNHKLELFTFDLSFIGHFLLFIITFGLYGIYFLPYYKVSAVNYYLYLTNQKSSNNLIAIEPDEFFSNPN